MSDKNNGWQQPEIKIPETELEDSFAGFFSEEEEINYSQKGKKRRKSKSGPDILAVSEEADPGFVITEVVAFDTGSEVVQIKEEPADEEKTKEPTEEAVLEHEEEPEEKPEEENTEKADAQAKNSEPEEAKESDEEEVIVDLSKAEEPEEPKEKKKVLFENAKKHINKRRKHKYVATVGMVLIALAVIGSIALCSVLITLGARLLDNTNQKEAFEWKVYPLLMFDPATFEDPKQLDEELLLKSALWATLFENRTKYSYDDFGYLLVPASDLDVAAKSLYGNNITLEHKTFAEGYDYTYTYYEETNTYTVPVMGQTASYTPKVVDIKKNGDIYTLIVGYVSPTTLWSVSEEGSSEGVPDKYLYYDLEKIDRGSFIIKSVRTIPEDELPEDLEVSDMQFMNQTQYIDYDAAMQEQMAEQLEENEAAEDETKEATSTGEGDTSEGE